jgi:hypothetical protein
LFTIASLLVGADTPGVTYVSHDKVAAALAKGGGLIQTAEITVSGSHRDKGGQVEVHEKETDILYIIEGATTFVTGGTNRGREGDQARATSGDGDRRWADSLALPALFALGRGRREPAAAVEFRRWVP